MRKSSNWDRRFIGLAKHISEWSKDPSTKVGCVVVGEHNEVRSMGFNGFPRGIEDDDRLKDREAKYTIICHAEENAILNASLTGTSLHRCVCYVYPFPPCTRCARMIIQAGISEVVVPPCAIPERWLSDFETARGLLEEAQVECRLYIEEDLETLRKLIKMVE